MKMLLALTIPSSLFAAPSFAAEPAGKFVCKEVYHDVTAPMVQQILQNYCDPHKNFTVSLEGTRAIVCCVSK